MKVAIFKMLSRRSATVDMEVQRLLRASTMVVDFDTESQAQLENKNHSPATINVDQNDHQYPESMSTIGIQ